MELEWSERLIILYLYFKFHVCTQYIIAGLIASYVKLFNLIANFQNLFFFLNKKIYFFTFNKLVIYNSFKSFCIYKFKNWNDKNY
jgi:hypothetical protein